MGLMRRFIYGAIDRDNPSDESSRSQSRPNITQRPYRFKERWSHHSGQSHSRLIQAACNTVDTKGMQTNQQSDQVIPESPVYDSLFDTIDSYVVSEVR
ncbi:MAG: hypothetical protein FRX49_00130 [Trebouxia sp. A1-2]|nr:MAG: hypothetical protein FRX49_00130 [Trebouxia sp. A1-2]